MSEWVCLACNETFTTDEHTDILLDRKDRRIATLDKKVAVIYSGYEVWQKIKETCPETTMTANDMGDVLDAINLLWKEQGE